MGASVSDRWKYPPILYQDKLNRYHESEQSEERQLKASPGFCSKYKMQKIKKNVEETKQLIENLSRADSLPRIPAELSKTPAAAQTEEFECLVCLNLPLAKVFICTECEGTLCESCKTELERTHEQSRRVDPLSCPQCKTPFVNPGNPIRSRKTERLIKNLMQQ